MIQERLEYGDVHSCEDHLAGIGDLAIQLDKLCQELGAEAKKLSSAAAVGNLQSLRKAASSIKLLLETSHEPFRKATAIDIDPIARAVGTRRFMQEVVDAAAGIGFAGVRFVGNSLLAFPNRLTPDEKGLKIGRKLVTQIRPSTLARQLKIDAEEAANVRVGFIDSLLGAYDVLSRGSAEPVQLQDIYNILTLLPESKKLYSESEFVRDLSILDANGPHDASDGRRISFINATSTRMGKGLKAVSPTGEDVTYMTIRFRHA